MPGARARDRCALIAGNGHGFLVAAWAILRLGAILVPVNNRLASPEVTYIVQHSGCSMLVYDDGSKSTTERALSPRQGPGAARAVRLADMLATEGRTGLATDTVTEDDDAIILYTSDRLTQRRAPRPPPHALGRARAAPDLRPR
jgi:fatty-acyl-CoA synthase